MSAEPDKHPAILAVLNRLRLRLGRQAFVVHDHWAPDLCAVGIASPHDAGVLIYISCYDQPPDQFQYELEFPPLPNDDFPYRTGTTGSGVTFEELAGIVAHHLSDAPPTLR